MFQQLRTLFPMTIFRVSCPHAGHLSLFALCLLSVLPAWSAQAGKELVADACYNERYQLEHETLWSSEIQRRTGGHVYLEKQVETLDGPVRRLIAIDGNEPSPAERTRDDDRLRNLLQNPKAGLQLKKDREADLVKVSDLLRVIPEAFLFEDQGNQGNIEKLAFRPNPAYKPKSYEERVLHAMSGIILVDVEEKRLAQISATLIEPVDFGYGVLGRLKQGGSVSMTRVRLSPGIWKTSSYRIDINGRLIFFKTIGKQQDEIRSDFKPVGSNTSIAEALQQLGSK
jgi:hypothetical protein